jgi:hypothetical protein
MNDDLLQELELDPSLVRQLTLVHPERPAVIESIEPPNLPVVSMLDGLSLQALLGFLPDVKMKRELTALADAALAVKVEGKAGVEAADAALVPLRDGIKNVMACFAQPVSEANALHKRLTGLRADFIASGEIALDHVGRCIVAETRRLDAEAAAVERQTQMLADESAKKTAAAAVKMAEEQNAPPLVVEALKAQAEVATAPPVALGNARPSLKGASISTKRKARLKSSPEGSEPNPATKDLTDAEIPSVMLVLQAIVNGKAPLSYIDLNWGIINRDANAGAFSVPGLETFEDGSLRKRPSR